MRIAKKKKDEVFKELSQTLAKSAKSNTTNPQVTSGQAVGMIQALRACGFLSVEESTDWLVRFFDIV